MGRRWRPNRQDGECLLARWTSAPAYPVRVVLVIVSLPAASDVTNNRIPATTRTSARQLLQADLDYPGLALSSVHGSAIKRINGWREGPPLVSPPKFDPATGPSPSCYGPVSNEKRISASW